ncbi:hypothetical protein C8J56DRAFT_957158 [Mycena floridula]|nr:hypothetical protein C8J56DRAFT_957158 [Mycena floridula]
MFSLQVWFRSGRCSSGLFSLRSSHSIPFRLLSTAPPNTFRLNVMPLPENPLPKEPSLAEKVIQDSFQSFGKIRGITLPKLEDESGKTAISIDFEPTEDLKARWESSETKQQKVTGVNGHEFEVSQAARLEKRNPSVRVYVGMPTGNPGAMPKPHVEAALAEFGKIARIERSEPENVVVAFERREDATKAIKGHISLPDGTRLSPVYALPHRSPNKIMEFFLSGPLEPSADEASIQKHLLDSLALADDDKPEIINVKLPLGPEKPAIIKMKFKNLAVSRKVMKAVESLETVEIRARYFRHSTRIRR